MLPEPSTMHLLDTWGMCAEWILKWENTWDSPFYSTGNRGMWGITAKVPPRLCYGQAMPELGSVDDNRGAALFSQPPRTVPKVAFLQPIVLVFWKGTRLSHKITMLPQSQPKGNRSSLKRLWWLPFCQYWFFLVPFSCRGWSEASWLSLLTTSCLTLTSRIPWSLRMVARSMASFAPWKRWFPLLSTMTFPTWRSKTPCHRKKDFFVYQTNKPQVFGELHASKKWGHWQEWEIV